MYRIKRSPRAAGFTLVELLVTVAIIALVSSVAATNVVRQMPRQRLNSAAKQMAWNLRALRMQAISQNRSVTVTFINEYVYTIWTDSNANGTAETGEVQTKNISSNYSGVTLASTNNPVFNPTGTVSNLASITFTGAGSSKVITMTAAGEIKLY
jgi:type IV fimbrial biogenesis protein FimT